MSQAVEAYRGITATEEFRYLEILRERARHDEAQAIFVAEQRGAETERAKWLTERDKWQAEVDKLRSELAKFQAERTS